MRVADVRTGLVARLRAGTSVPVLASGLPVLSDNIVEDRRVRDIIHPGEIPAMDEERRGIIAETALGMRPGS